MSESLPPPTAFSEPAASDRSSGSAFLATFRIRTFQRIIGHHALSSIGQSLATVAIATSLLDQPGGRAWVPVAAAARFVPYLVCSPLAGMLADRFGCRRVLAWSAIVRVVLTSILAFVLFSGSRPELVVILVFAMTAAGTPSYPALAALLPWAVPATSLGAANGIFSTVESVSWIIGPAAGGLLLLVSAPGVVLVCNAAVLVGAWAVLPRSLEVGAAADEADGTAGGGWWRVLAERDVSAPLLLVLAVNLVFGGASVGLVLVSAELLHAGGAGAGLLNAALGLGSVVGVVAAERAVRGERSIHALAGGVLVAGLPLALLGVARTMPVACALMVVSGVGSIVTEVVSLTVLQRAVPARSLARVMGVLDALVVGSILVGSMLALPLTDLFGLRWSLTLVGAVLPAVAVTGAMRLATLGRRADARRAELSGRVRLMSDLPWMAGVLEPTLEALAAASRIEWHGAGDVVLREGDPPCDLFLVLDGVADVETVAEGVVARLGRGAGFGEIGLLTSSARTATVTVREPGQLLRIPGHAFLEAVSQVPAATGSVPGVGWMGRFGQEVPT